jgi:hypothetical protein
MFLRFTFLWWLLKSRVRLSEGQWKCVCSGHGLCYLTFAQPHCALRCLVSHASSDSSSATPTTSSTTSSISSSSTTTSSSSIIAAPPPVGVLGGGHENLPGATQGARNWVGKDKNGVFFFYIGIFKILTPIY